MTGLLRPRSVRVRLTLWYTGALCVVLLTYAVLVFSFLRHALYLNLDRRLREDVDLVQEELESAEDGRLVWRASGHPDEAEDSATIRGRWLEVWSREGQLLLRSATSDPLRLGPPEPSADPRAVSLPHGRAEVRVLSRMGTVAGLPVLVRVARSEEAVRHELRELSLVQGIGLPLALGLAAAGGYQLARRALAPVARMVDRARRISAERLSERLPVENPADELGQLATTFNETFGRLERSFDQLRRFTADASHELRTPLTVLRSVGEVGLQERPDDKLFGEVVGSMLEEVDRMARLVDTLLALSRADAGQLHLAREPLDLTDLAHDVAQHLADLAEEKGQRVIIEAREAARVTGDRLVLRQALVNVLDNAIKYSPAGALIRLGVGGGAEHCWITVADDGPGIPAEHRDRIFERFYRVDRARSREQGSAGLGLSLAKWAVEAHDGTLELETEVGRGSTFRIVLRVRSVAAPKREVGVPRPEPETLAIVTAALIALGGCSQTSRQVVVYTSVDQVFAEPVLRSFERGSGVRVRAVFDTEETKSTGVLNRLIAEGQSPQADVFWSGDPVRPFLLVKRGLVEPYVSPQAAGLPAGLRAADGTWTGIAARARVFLVNRDRVTAEARPPKSLSDLTDPRWRGQAAIANPLFGTTTMHVAALFAAWGEERARAFLEALKANAVRIASSNGEVKRLVVSGEIAFGLTDTDDAYEALKESSRVDVVYPDSEGPGTLVMPTAVVLMRGGPNREAGRRLVDHLLSAETEQRMGEAGAHMPLRSGVPTPPNVRRIGDLRVMSVDYGRVAEEMERIQPWLRQWAGL